MAKPPRKSKCVPEPAAAPAPALAARATRLWQVSLASAACSALAALYILDWPSWSVPLDQIADNLFGMTIAKTIQDFGWYGNNPRLGAPGTLHMADFPVADAGHILAMKLLGGVAQTPVQIVNAYFYLTFALCGGSAAWVLQRCGVQALAAAVGGLCYALLPYHFMRGCAHLWLGGYFGVPLSVYILLSVSEVLPPAQRLSRSACRWGAALLACFGAYYTFFFCYLLVAAVLLQASAVQRRLAAIQEGVWVLGAALGGTLVNLLPSLLRRMDSPDRIALLRDASDAEVYGLKLVQMFVPVAGHRNPTLAALSQIYNRAAPLVTENASASMGLVLSVAFVGVTGYACHSLWRGDAGDAGLRSRLCKTFLLSLLCFIYGTIGGISSLIGFYVSLFVRSSNRIVVFIDFFTLLCAGWLLRRAAQRFDQASWGRQLAAAVAILCCGLTLWENHDTDYFPRRQDSAALYAHDARFFAHLEKNTPPDSQIFQLPYVPFPEGGLGPQDYFQARPFLHTTSGRYSFGAMRGGRADAQNRALAALLTSDAAKFTQALRAQGFTGVLLSRSIPSRERTPWDPLLQRVLGAPSLVSPNREWAYFAVP